MLPIHPIYYVREHMPAVKISPMKLPPNPWVEGFVLDYHTISSTPTGDPYYRFDTKRTPLGELLYQIKYRAGGSGLVADVVDTATQFLEQWRPPVQCIAIAPPSQNRKVQPTLEFGRELARRVRLPVCENAVVKIKETSQMKNIDDWAERQRVLAEAVQAGPSEVRNRVVLLLDDLIESGATLRRAGEVLLSSGATSVYALVLTRTK